MKIDKKCYFSRKRLRLEQSCKRIFLCGKLCRIKIFITNCDLFIGVTVRENKRWTNRWLSATEQIKMCSSPEIKCLIQLKQLNKFQKRQQKTKNNFSNKMQRSPAFAYLHFWVYNACYYPIFQKQLLLNHRSVWNSPLGSCSLRVGLILAVVQMNVDESEENFKKIIQFNSICNWNLSFSLHLLWPRQTCH